MYQKTKENEKMYLKLQHDANQWFKERQVIPKDLIESFKIDLSASSTTTQYKKEIGHG